MWPRRNKTVEEQPRRGRAGAGNYACAISRSGTARAHRFARTARARGRRRFHVGLHRSPFTGFSTEFTEYRQYNPGDDLRYLDWRLLGRTDRYFIKKYRADTNTQCHLL